MYVAPRGGAGGTGAGKKLTIINEQLTMRNKD